VEELTPPSLKIADSEPFFLDDDNIAFFHHDADSSAKVDQLYVLNLQSKEQYALSNFSISVENVKYHVDKKLLAFSASVYNSEDTLEGTLAKDNAIAAEKKDTGLVYDQLMVR
jgi:acylaminoacyl-peptidase